MIKSILNSNAKVLNTNEKKAIVGGACPGGGGTMYCPRLKKRVCPDVC